MSQHCGWALKPVLQCLRSPYRRTPVLGVQSTRGFQSTAPVGEEEEVTQKSSQQEALDPALVSTPQQEKKLLEQGIQPIGSRRRRAALQSSAGIPFEQLPYQCFQEARKVLLADRQEKLAQIESTRNKIARVQALSVEGPAGENWKKSKVKPLQLYLNRLKIRADINDPLVKKRFEDGKGMVKNDFVLARHSLLIHPCLGDMRKPIYRFLADRKWREYQRKILVQRITQMRVTPDVLPHCDPTVETTLYFGRRKVPPGEFVQAMTSFTPPTLNVQMFERGEKLVTVAVADPDVPNVEKDSFDYKVHYLAVNIPISVISTRINFSGLSADSQIVFPWLPPVAQKGSPYHRLSIFVLEQKNSEPLDYAAVKESETDRDNTTLRSIQRRYSLKPIGAHLFRTRWDGTTEEVMKQISFADADMELRRRRVQPLPYKRRNPPSFR